MTSRTNVNQTTPIRGLGVPKATMRLSPRAKWKRAAKKMERVAKGDVDRESVPLTEKESLQRQNSIKVPGQSNGELSMEHIPNVVQYDINETDSLAEGKDDGQDTVVMNELSNRLNDENTKNNKERNTKTQDSVTATNTETNLSDPAINEYGHVGGVTQHSQGNSHQGLNKSNKDLILRSIDGPIVEITSEHAKESDTQKLNGSVINSKESPKVSKTRLNNDIPLKESLTVPGVDPVSSGSKDPGSKSSNGSVFSFGRESSRLSLDSRKSVDPKIQYAAVQMPEDDKAKSSMFAPEESLIKTVIPHMPLGVAVTCLVMNIIIPGSGTILSGVTIFCCGHSRVPQKYDQDTILVMCLNTWVGVAQLFTVTFMLVGWFWSLAWGITMVTLSVERRREMQEERENELKKRALEAFGTSIPGRVSVLG